MFASLPSVPQRRRFARRARIDRIVPPLRVHAVGLVVGALCLGACATKPDRLPELDRRFYYNLPTPEDQQEFLRIRERDRPAFPEQKGLCATWTALPAEQPEAAGKGRVEVGLYEFAVFMAWGPPADTQDRDRDGRPARIHTFIRCSSGPKAGRYVRDNLDCDGTSDETQVAIANGIVYEIRYPN